MVGVGRIINAISQREGKMWRGTDRSVDGTRIGTKNV